MKHFTSLVTVLALMSIVAGCAIEPVPPCPEIRIDSNTAAFTVFRENGGQDITDIAYEAEIVSFEGSCAFDDDGVEVRMDMDIVISGGPAVQPGNVDLYYFVAIPKFHPNPEGKRIFSRAYKFPRSSTRRERLTESNIRIFLPLEDRITAAAYDIYLGFQLTDEQLAYNRSRKR